jgi:hypothetical protein
MFITGCKSSCLLRAFICEKHSKISSATNKEFASGQIVNFIQMDSQEI